MYRSADKSPVPGLSQLTTRLGAVKVEAVDDCTPELGSRMEGSGGRPAAILSHWQAALADAALRGYLATAAAYLAAAMESHADPVSVP